MFHVSVARAQEIMDAMAHAMEHIANNYLEHYSVEGTGEFAGKYRLHEGKALQDFLALATNEGEWCFILFNANIAFDELRQRHKLDLLKDRLKDKIMAVKAKL